MVEAQFLIVLLIFNISNSFCGKVLEEEESFVELGLFRMLFYEYHKDKGAYSTCKEMIMEGPQHAYEVQPFIENNGCMGEIMSCEWSGDTTICASTMGRFNIQWSKAERYGLRYTYGQPDTCSGEEALALYSTSSDRSVCQCHCLKKNWGIHLGLMQSRERDNYVITGIRFIVRNNVLYLQPAEGKLGVNLAISDVSWIPFPIEPSEIHGLDRASRHFFLDDLILDEGYVLTGVKFDYIEAPNPKMVKGFGISVSGRSFFSTGDVDLRLKNTLTIKPKSSTERYSASDLPILPSNRISQLSRENHEYIKLIPSLYKWDMAQTTYPFFHNPRVTKYDKVLSGFGIFFNTSSSKEQFLSLRVHLR